MWFLFFCVWILTLESWTLMSPAQRSYISVSVSEHVPRRREVKLARLRSLQSIFPRGRRENQFKGVCNHTTVRRPIQFLQLLSGDVAALTCKYWSPAGAEPALWASLKLLPSTFAQNTPTLAHNRNVSLWQHAVLNTFSSQPVLHCNWKAIAGAALKISGSVEWNKANSLSCCCARPWRLDRLRGGEDASRKGRKKKKKGTDYVMRGLVYMFPLSSCSLKKTPCLCGSSWALPHCISVRVRSGW